jgi:hypothetical protein
VQADRRRRPLLGQPAVLEHADAVLAADRAAERDGHREELAGRRLRALGLAGVARVEQERRVQVAVAGVAPGAGLEPVALADGHGLGDRLGEPVERDGDVLGELAAPPGADRVRHARAPLPQRPHVGRRGRGVEHERVVARRLEQLVARALGLLGRPVGLEQQQEARPSAPRGTSRPRRARRPVEVLDRRGTTPRPAPARSPRSPPRRRGQRGDRQRGLRAPASAAATRS